MKKKFSKLLSVLLAVAILAGIAPLNGFKLTAGAATALQVGDIVEFGSYPQHSGGPSDGTKLETLVDEWISMNYTEGDDYFKVNYCQAWNNGRMKPTDYRMYADIVYDGVKYRVLRESAKMPSSTGLKWTRTEVTYSYFIFEPIEWEVMDSRTLRTVKAIDSQPFNQYNTSDGNRSYSDEACTHAASNFNYSSLKSWLNSDFYNSAFSSAEKRNINGSVSIPDVRSSSSLQKSDLRYQTLYAKIVVGDLNSIYDGFTWTKTPLNSSFGIVQLNGSTGNAHPGQFGIGVVAEIKLINSCIHNYNSEITKEATCKETGTIKYTCVECGSSYTEKIPLLTEHSLIHKAENATCTEDGAEYDFCTVCESKFNETVLPAAGHIYYAPVIIAPTCKEAGAITYTCHCGYSYTEVIPAKEHNLIHTIERATCTESGLQYDFCLDCGDSFNETIIPAKGHNFVNGVCTVCGKSDKWDYSVTGGKVTINGYNGNESELEIPSAIDSYPVDAIADSAFAGNKTLTFVSVPDSVVSIGENAFKGCTSLKEVFVGSGVLAIGENAFADCTKLAVFCITSRSAKLDSAFSNNDSRLFIVVPYGSATANNASKTGITKLTYQYSLYKGNRYAIGFNGFITLYRDLDYNFWTKLINVYPDAHYLYFFRLTFDGIYPDVIYVDDDHLVENSKYLTMKEVFISVRKSGKSITFKEMLDLLNSGDGEMIISFIDDQGQNRTVSEKTLSERVDEIVTAVFNALSKAINAIVSIFKKKK